MRVISVALAVARKDLMSEWRTRELVPALAQFVVLALVIANFGFQFDTHTAPAIAPGVLWMALVFAGLVAFGRAFAAEREQSSLEAMLMTPASPAAIFAGKALAAALLLVVCEAVLLPALALFFRVPLSVAVVSAVLLATVGMAVLGCLFAAMVARVRARELLLPVLTLPLWIPFIVVGGQAVQAAMGGGGGGASQATGLLVDLDILFVVLTSLTASFAVVLLGGIVYLWKENTTADRLARAGAVVGLVFTTVTLVMGMIWAKPIWGTFWTWDARLTSTLVLWIIYAGYLMIRRLAEPGRQAARFAAVVGIFGFIDVPVVHFSVTWWRTQHPGPVVINDALPPQMLVAFFVTMACTLFLAAVMIAIRYRIEVLTDQAAEKVVVAPIIASSEAGTAR